MVVENKKILYKNLEKFEFIVDYFFLRKTLYCWNYQFVYFKVIKKVIKEIKGIILKEDTENSYNYVKMFQIKVSKKKVKDLNKISLLLKEIYYQDLLEYLKTEKNKRNFEIVQKNFFYCLENYIHEHFMIKRRFYNEEEPKIIDIAKKNLGNIDYEIDKFFTKNQIDISNYRPAYKKFINILKSNFKSFKKILESNTQKDFIFDYIKILVENLVKDETKNLNNCKNLIKKRNYNNILKYLEIEKKSKKFFSFDALNKDFFDYLYENVYGHFIQRKFYKEKEESKSSKKKNEIQSLNIIKKILKNIDYEIDKFFDKKQLDISNYHSTYKKFAKKLKKSLEKAEKKENIFVFIQLLIKNLAREEIPYSIDRKYLIKKRNYNNILKYLEMEKKEKVFCFERMDEDFFDYLYENVYDHFFIKKRVENYEKED